MAPPNNEVAEVVVTGTRTPEASQRSTVKTDVVVTRAEAERRGATNVAEALATQPGVRVDPGAYGHLGGVGAIRIQGFDLQRVLILEDGEPVVGDVGGAVDLAGIPVSDVARIEIVTGPTSALYGSSAIGGVINIITSAPRAEGPSGRARVEGRSYRGVVLQGNAAARADRAWISVDTNFFRQDAVTRTPGLPDTQVPETTRAMVGLRAGARVAERGSGPITTLANVDGTAGGTTAPPNAPSECVDLARGERIMLAPDEAQRSSAWHLCFRRDSITVNGGIGGPRGVTAVDIGAPGLANETLDAVKVRTADGMMGAFDGATSTSFEGRTFRGDHVVSAFGDLWVDRASSPWQPLLATWLVVDRTGQRKFLVAFTSFDAPSSKSPRTVVMRVKPMKG